MNVTVSGALPEDGEALNVQVGVGVGGGTVISLTALPDCPFVLLTTRIAVYVPAAVYVCVTVGVGVPSAAGSCVPSPKPRTHPPSVPP